MQSPATDDLASALLRASRVLVGVAARSLSDAEEVVTLTQFRTLVVLDGLGQMNLVRLAGRLGVNSSTAQRMVERLVRTGLVSRDPHPDNRREVLLSLTPEGQDLVDRVTSRRRRELAEIALRMPPETRETFVAALEAFSAAAGEPEVKIPRDALWDWSTDDERA